MILSETTRQRNQYLTLLARFMTRKFFTSLISLYFELFAKAYSYADD